MSENKSSSNTGCSSTTIFLIFLILKLTDVIDWSWWWVTCPLWIGFVITITIVFVTGGIGGLILMLAAIFGRK